MVGQGFAERGVAIVDDVAGCGAMAAAALELGNAAAAAEVADQACGEHDQRKGRVEEEDGDEGGGGDAAHDVIFKRTRADADDGLHDYSEDGGFQAEEKTLDQRHLAEQDVDIAEP